MGKFPLVTGRQSRRSCRTTAARLSGVLTRHAGAVPMIAIASFLESRDFLLAHRADYEVSREGFVWPRQTHFNWELDYFDPMAVGNENTALWIVEESGEECRLSFAALATRSNQVANWLRAQGVQRGDRLLLMLGNEVALWEVMLAAIKLGVVLIPTSGLLARDD